MAPSRCNSNGRSPLVNRRRQITSFFCPISKTTTSPSSISPVLPPYQNSKPSPNSTSSPSHSNPKKPLLVIGPTRKRTPPIRSSEALPKTPESAKRLYGEEVVGKRFNICWSPDKSWCQGFVKLFDDLSGKHLIQYDDGEEETLDLEKEKIEWVEEAVTSLRRLKRKASEQKKAALKDEVEDRNDSQNGIQQRRSSVSKKMGVVEKDEEVVTRDEDWGSKIDNETIDEDSEEVNLEEEEL